MSTILMLHTEYVFLLKCTQFPKRERSMWLGKKFDFLIVNHALSVVELMINFHSLSRGKEAAK